jgi:5-methyltetrahydropteroyltriglutamate--homocysteine methyltransferase
LPRPDDLLRLLQDREEGRLQDVAAFGARVSRAVVEAVQRQVETGVDVVSDGEQGKPSYSTYIKDRLTGFDGESVFWVGADVAEFPEYAARRRARTFEKRPACTGPIAWKDWAAVQKDIDNLKAAAATTKCEELFMTAVSPGQAARFLHNRYYPTEEAYLWALAEVMKREYRAIAQAGFVLQLDCPDLGSGRHNQFKHLTLPEFRKVVTLHVEVLNWAVAEIPPDRMRLHLCWGNAEGPHHWDVPLKEILDLVLLARPAGLSFPGANPRHEHEWKVWKDVKLPEGKMIIPGVLDTTTNFIEHPELVAERIARYASVVGRGNVIAGTDCGFGSFAGSDTVDASIAWHKLRAMVEGARLASQELW